AEDGIRDFHVTGVQTCALPIFPLVSVSLGSVDYDNTGIPHSGLLHQRIEDRGVTRMQAHAAMRCRPTQMFDGPGAVNRISTVIEDRIWHGRHVVFARIPHAMQALWAVRATRGDVALARR